MDGNTRYVIGYDLNDIQVQISYFELNKKRRGKLVSDGENERLGVPTVLCKRKSVKQWSFGTEAQRLIRRDGEAEVNKLLSLALSGRSITIDGEDFNGIDLLILFVRKTLKLLSVYVSVEQIDNFVFTVPELNRDVLSVLERVAAAVPVERSRILFQSYSEAVYCYMIHQPEELWDPECVIFNHDGKSMTAYHMQMNHRTTPVVGVIDKTVYDGLSIPDMSTYYDGEDDEYGDDDVDGSRPSDDEKGQGGTGTQEELQDLKNARMMISSEKEIEAMDEELYGIVHDFLITRTIRSAYLLGPGFDGEWCKKTIGFLCMGRRVFQGNNMYSKGACYAGAVRSQAVPWEFVYIGNNELKLNLSLKVIDDNEMKFVTLISAGDSWYDAYGECEVILDGSPEIECWIQRPDSRKAIIETLKLTDMPQRENRTTRLRIMAKPVSDTEVTLKVQDLGFGEIVPATNRIWERQIAVTIV